MITIPTLRGVLRAAVVPLLGYAITLGASLLLMILVVVGLAAGTDTTVSNDPSDSVDVQAIGTLIGMPFQLAAMALGGSIRLGEGDFGASLFAPPLLVTTIFVGSVFWLSRRTERRTPSASTAERVLLATAAALIVAVVAIVATRALAMRSDGVVMHAATIGLFFGTLVLAGAAGALGRQSAVTSLWPRWVFGDVRRAIQLVAQHLLAWIVVATPVVVLWVLLRTNLETAALAVVWVPTADLWAFAMGHLGAWTVFGTHKMAWGLGWFPGVALPLLALGLTLITSIVWHLRRRDDRELLTEPISWVFLPATYAVAGLLVSIVSTVVLSGDAFGGSLSASAHPAYWLIPVLAVWGVLIETLSRYVAPALAAVVPPRLAQRLAQGPKQLYSPPKEPARWIPMSPADRARAKRGAIALGGLTVLALVAIIAVNVVGATVYSPERQARAYLDALVRGDVAKAVELAPVDDDASSALLIPDVYAAAEDRITGYDITKVETHGSSATVTVDLEGPQDGHGVELSLSAHGSAGMFFHHWQVDDGGLARDVTIDVPDSSTSLAANGVSVPVTGGDSADFWVMPGSYAFNPYADSQWLQASDDRTAVPASESYGIYAEVSDPQPSDALKQAVDTKLASWLGTCMRATTLEPKGCPQSGYGYGDKQRDATWRLTSAPTVSWDDFYGDFPAELSTDTGKAKVTYEYDDSYGFGAPHWVKQSDTSSLYVNVKVELVNDQPEVTLDSY
ncbi:MAG TPA: hypothetical protein VN088_20725 [Nocardioides sp.]|nr:hypothetical protein [Nocardioides sp.]